MPWFRNPIRYAGLSLLGIAVVAVLFGLVFHNEITELRETRTWVRHTHTVINALDQLDIAIRDTERSQRGFLLTGKEIYLPPFNQGMKDVAEIQDSLAHLTNDNPGQQTRLNDLAVIVQHKLDEMGQAIDVVGSAMPGWRSATPILACSRWRPSRPASPNCGFMKGAC
jgi:CHASE3 domain sensor protein